MKNVGTRAWGITLHYYTLPTNNWQAKGSATQFDEKQYHETLKNCLHMEELVTRHSAVMDKYDAAKKVALLVDEWGIWTDVEPGTNPGFLYQQNSLRDALVAGTTLNIFNNHAYRVKGANLAQSINVLQSLILTKGRQMILTPTYHVFDLYKVHQDAKLLPVKFDSPGYEIDGSTIPAINMSASQDSVGTVHISLVNLDPNKSSQVTLKLDGIRFSTVTGRILTSANLTDINTFEKPNNLQLVNFTSARKEGNDLVVDLPGKSVVVVELK